MHNDFIETSLVFHELKIQLWFKYEKSAAKWKKNKNKSAYTKQQNYKVVANE